MKIGDFDTEKKVLIVAEIGNNHEGSVTLAEEMIGLAAEAGADAVKFQTIVPERLVSVLQTERIEQLKKFQLGYEDFEKLAKTAKQEHVIFFSTPFDIESARFLAPIVPAYKIASGDNTFYPLLEAVATTGKPIILSTGLVTIEEIERAIGFIRNKWMEMGVKEDVALLHCVVSYPTASHEANLLAIKTLQELGVTVGYSDHTMGIEAAILAVALGARIIEKHFTIDKNYSDFHDHQLSADPKDLAQLTKRIKRTVELLGHGKKHPQESEKAVGQKVRRSIVAGRNLDEGTVLSWDDLSWIRPGGGLPPGRENEVLGRILVHPIQLGGMIQLDDVVPR